MTRIGVTVADTVNLGNYESAKPSVYIEVELEPGKSLKEAHAELSAVARALMLYSVVVSAEDAKQRRGIGVDAWLENALKEIRGQAWIQTTLKKAVSEG